jgi:Zn ribbon nucleic-acid-binding protein
MSEELKPCPFCNRTDNLRVLSEGQINAVFGVVCYHCGCQFHCRADSEADAKIAFNTRPIEDALRAEIDQLKHMYATQYGELAAVNKINGELKHQIANLQQRISFLEHPAVGVEG